MRRVLTLTGAVVMLVGCAPKYTGPAQRAEVENTTIIAAPFDKAWELLIDYAGSTFFAIDSFEKDSGLMTLSFGAGDPERFMDCGFLEATNLSGMRGPFVELAETSPNAISDFSGRMNLVMRSISNEETSLTVNTRYVYQVRTDSWGNTWSFDSGGSDTKTVGAGVQATSITCRATGEAERAIIDGIRSGSLGGT